MSSSYCVLPSLLFILISLVGGQPQWNNSCCANELKFLCEHQHSSMACNQFEDCMAARICLFNPPNSASLRYSCDMSICNKQKEDLCRDMNNIDKCKQYEKCTGEKDFCITHSPYQKPIEVFCNKSLCNTEFKQMCENPDVEGILFIFI